MNREQQFTLNAVAQTLRQTLTTLNSDTKHDQSWHDYGYPESLTFERHYQMYRRNSYARAAIDIKADYSWAERPIIHTGEADADERNEWEQRLDDLFEQHQLWTKFSDADKEQAIGEYGAFVIQVKGDAQARDWGKKLGTIRPDQIVRIIPVNQGQLEPADWDNDRSSVRFGQPESYNLQEDVLFEDRENDQRNRAVTVHHSRVVVFAEGASDSDSIYGHPANEACFNDLLVIQKIVGAGGEGIWKNAAMKMIFNQSNKDAPAPTPDELDSMDDAIGDFVQHLDKYLISGQLDPKVLEANLPDPQHYFGFALSGVAATHKIPTKILTGTQTGKLAGDEDGRFFLSGIQSRCHNWCNRMVRSFVDWLIEHGALQSVSYTIEWPDLLAPSDSDKLENAKAMTLVNKDNALIGQVFTVDEIRQAAGYKPMKQIDEPDVDSDDPEGDEEEGAE